MKKIFTLILTVAALAFSPSVASADEVTFDFTNGSLRGYAGKALTDVDGYIYNETYQIDGVQLNVIAGSAPSRLTFASNRDTCLVLYMQYSTLKFKAPEGKLISNIDFTFAGTGTLNLTPSSGTLDGLSWTGLADGVRFLNNGTAYIQSVKVTLAGQPAELQPLSYTAVDNIAAFNALDAGTHVKLALKDAEVIGVSADGYSTVFVQDATGGTLIQYTSLNTKLKANTKITGEIYAVKRVASGNTQIKETENTVESSFEATDITEFTTLTGTIAELNVAANLGRVVKIAGATFKATSATAGTLKQGDDEITVNNGAATANQQLHLIDFAKDDEYTDVTIIGILNASSATKNQILPLVFEGTKTATGIRERAAVAGLPAIYSLQGVRQSSLRKGLNIQGGKKIIVK